MTWEIVAGIIALAGFVLTVVTASGKLTRALASLETVVEMLRDTVDKFKASSHETHEKIFEKLGDHGEQLADHESRLKTLEKEKENRK